MKYLVAALFSFVTTGVINLPRMGELAVTIGGVKMASGTLLVALTSEAAGTAGDKPPEVEVGPAPVPVLIHMH